MERTPVAEEEVDALVARLRFELEATGEDEPSDAPAWQGVRVRANRLAGVTGDRPFFRRGGTLGRIRSYATIPAKAVIRKLVRWYVEPIAAEQRAFNASVLELVDAVAVDTTQRRHTLQRAVDTLSERVDVVEGPVRGQVHEHGRRLTELDERLVRVERRPAAPATAAAAQPPAGAETGAAAPARAVQPLIDYFAFESRMRDSREAIAARQAHYVEDFRGAGPVLDVGCGRGEFLELLREAGVDARGIDMDSDMVEFCRGEGLHVEQADALEHLAGLEPGSLGGIFCAHVVEHLRAPELVRLLELAAAALRPDGVLAAETPNPRTLVALGTFFADLTHERPLHPETLAFLVRQAGFREVETRFLNEPPDEARLQPVPLPDGDAWEPARRALAENTARLNEVVFGPQDYAVLARR